ncbi:hypothetical protein LTR15_010920 [Elasticomyces elasticus]|nr:hypothetical protein LTR15_010920 [Elasticomyces elasticus]
MADIAFGVVGVAGLAIQLAESVKKLQAFIVLVKDVPAELQELIEYMDTSREWLDSITSTLVPAMDPTLTSRCEVLCRQAVEKIAVVAKELEQGMQTKKRRTAMKLAWNTDGIERLPKRLESSKLDLHLAHSIFESEQLRAEVLQQLRISRDTMVDLNLEAYTRHQDSQQGVSQSINDGIQAAQQSFDPLQSGQSVLQQEVQSSHFAQQQNLLSLRTEQARMEQALRTGQAQTRQDIRAEASAITGHLGFYQHQTIAHLDLFKQEILDAVKAQSLPVCNAPFGSVFNFTDELYCITNTVTRLWNMDYCYEDPTKPRLGGGKFVRKWFKVASLAQDSPEVVPQALADLPDTWSDEGRFEVLSWVQYEDDAVFEVVYVFSSFSPQLLAMWGANGFTVMHAFAISDPFGIATDVWGFRLREFFESCVQTGADLHPCWRDRSGEDTTPLAAMICRFAESDNLKISTAVVQWIGALLLAKVDPEEYGRAEMDVLRKLRGTADSVSGAHVPYLVAYGPTIGDWEFLEMHPGDIHAGLFWNMVEHPEASIPGAWLDDEDQAVKIEDELMAGIQRRRHYRWEYCERRRELGRETAKFEKMQRQNGVDVDEEQRQ